MNEPTLYDPKIHLAQSKPTKELMHLSMREGWVFAILGIAPMPNERIRMSKWEIVPAHLDTSEIPARPLTRIQAIFAAGIRPKGFVLVHELPDQLPAGAADIIDGEYTVIKPYEITLDVGKVIDLGLKAVGAMAMATIAVAGVVLPAMFAMGSALLLDPILVAVTEDNVWIEIDRWYE
ncbi:MAG: hypothetical protein KF821_02100 [Anaerolineales bacterium]|nr:hypothetical protein [Anaerolineales bacterium]